MMLIAIDSGCTDVDSMHVTAAACCAVQADYSYAPSPPCKGDTIVFTNNSVGANQFEWQIDGNTVDTSSSYSHVFTADGNFNVSLIAGDGSCSDTFNVPMSISTPTANFSFAPDTMNSLTYNFADSSTSAATWSWDFGDGNTSTSQNGQHTYANNGNYTVCLTVANSAGCEDSTCSVFTAGPVSRGDMHSNVRLVIFPNPTSGEIQIQSNIKIDKVEVLDLTGRATGKDINDLPAGTYLLRIETELGTVTEKVVRY